MARRRSTRALDNDLIIRSATVEMVLKSGVDGVAFRDIARAAKLTHGALYARFEDVEELLVDLWSHVLLPRAIALYNAASLAVTSPNKKTVTALMQSLRHPTAEDVVMVKVLWTARRLVIVHEEVESFIHDYLENPGAEVDGAVQSRTLSLFSLMLLALFASAQGTLESHDIDCFETTILEALKTPADDVTTLDFDEPLVRTVPLPGDDLRERLTYHAFMSVGKIGYARATISRISRRADCSPGAIYKIYASKEELVIDAVNRNMEDPGLRIATLASLLEPGNFAQVLYSAASTKNHVRKDFTLEVAMASAYSAPLRTAVRKRLRDVEAIVPMIEGLSTEEVVQLTCMIRLVIFTVMGVSYLSTVTKATDRIDFNQFAEPLRRSILSNLVPRWPEIRRQLESISGVAHAQSPVAVATLATSHVGETSVQTD